MAASNRAPQACPCLVAPHQSGVGPIGLSVPVQSIRMARRNLRSTTNDKRRSGRCRRRTTRRHSCSQGTGPIPTRSSARCSHEKSTRRLCLVDGCFNAALGSREVTALRERRRRMAVILTRWRLVSHDRSDFTNPPKLLAGRVDYHLGLESSRLMSGLSGFEEGTFAITFRRTTENMRTGLHDRSGITCLLVRDIVSTNWQP